MRVDIEETEGSIKSNQSLRINIILLLTIIITSISIIIDNVREVLER